MIKFETNSIEAAWINLIVERALSQLSIPRHKRLGLEMDITACHLNGTRLNLVALANAEPADFSHDIAGIQFHINRETGKLDNCFTPRYAK